MPSAKRILLVDENRAPRQSLTEQLVREAAYQVIEADCAADARAAADYAFAIIDAGLDGGKGESLARELRQDGFCGPILLLTEAEQAVAGEHLAKPFRLAALLARLSVHLGHHGAGEENAVALGPYLFRPGAKLLTGAAGKKIRLTEKETSILKFLHRAGQTVPRETLLHEVWGYSPAVTTHTLETHIYRLRRKIEADPAAAKILLTEDGGYRLGPDGAVNL